MVCLLIAARRDSRERLFSMTCWLTVANVFCGLCLYLLLFFGIAVNELGLEPIAYLSLICLCGVAVQFQLLFWISMSLWLGGTFPARSVLLAGFNLAPFIISITMHQLS